jgi:15-cis-phytoene synthase
MKELFDRVSARCSELTTKSYSTSFSLGILFLDKKIRQDIYAIYGFVRFADEIVDTFHEYPREILLEDFRRQTYEAVKNKISLNPILNSFQNTVNRYGLKTEHIDAFLHSMSMDLKKVTYNEKEFGHYILGSAEVVGLMCLQVFCEGNNSLYESLKGPAMKLGSAFQKVNFLRDLKHDQEELGRNYFPGVDFQRLHPEKKKEIEQDIENDFTEALEGIKRLPRGTRFGVYLAYVYYKNLFAKIRKSPAEKVKTTRLRVSNPRKIGILCTSYINYNMNWL